jgi:hypothetical protein
MAQVKIGPSFFSKAKNDYSSWQWAIVREALQNCFDAPKSNKVAVTVSSDANHTYFSFENNGKPMNEAELTGKLLALGESGKDGISSVGGFGKAKEVLYFCWASYLIESGSLQVMGCGGDYTLQHLLPKASRKGTYSQISIPGEHSANLCEQVRKFASCAKWGGELTLNGRLLKTNNHNGAKRREFDWATIYTNNSYAHRLVVRVNGVPMFTKYTSVDKTVVLELTGGSLAALAANRDSLRYEYSEKFDAFVAEMTTNKNTVFKMQDPVYTHYQGDKLGVEATSQVAALLKEIYEDTPDRSPAQAERAEQEGSYVGCDHAADFEKGEHSQQPAVAARHTTVKGSPKVNCNFIVRNSFYQDGSAMEIPAKYLPGTFDAYSQRIVKLWVGALVALHKMLGRSDEFSVGFVFDDSIEALYEVTPEYGLVYYINPTLLKTVGKKITLKPRYKLRKAGIYAILANAVHEYTHKEHGSHDEDYACRLTDYMGMVMAQFRSVRAAMYGRTSSRDKK